MVKSTQTYACMQGKKRVKVGLLISVCCCHYKSESISPNNQHLCFLSLCTNTSHLGPFGSICFKKRKGHLRLQREASFHKINMHLDGWKYEQLLTTDVMKGFNVSWRYSWLCDRSSDDLRFAWALINCIYGIWYWYIFYIYISGSTDHIVVFETRSWVITRFSYKQEKIYLQHRKWECREGFLT